MNKRKKEKKSWSSISKGPWGDQMTIYIQPTFSPLSDWGKYKKMKIILNFFIFMYWSNSNIQIARQDFGFSN